MTQPDTSIGTLDLNESAPIASAAVLHNGIIHSMPRPNRHHNIVHAMNIKHDDWSILHAVGVQGFIDAGGRFLNRQDAAQVAAFWSQLKGDLIAPPNLYSEDLW